MAQRQFNEQDVRLFLFELGMHIPIGILGRLYDTLGERCDDPRNARTAPLERIARGVWQSNHAYAAGLPGDRNCDDGTQTLGNNTPEEFDPADDICGGDGSVCYSKDPTCDCGAFHIARV